MVGMSQANKHRLSMRDIPKINSEKLIFGEWLMDGLGMVKDRKKGRCAVD